MVDKDSTATERQLLEAADQRWRARAGGARFEDVPVIRPAAPWRRLPPPTAWTASSSAALCAESRNQMAYIPASGVHHRRRVDDDKVRQFWAQGWSDAQIARRLGVAGPSVGYARKRMGLAPNFTGRGCIK